MHEQTLDCTIVELSIINRLIAKKDNHFCSLTAEMLRIKSYKTFGTNQSKRWSCLIENNKVISP